MGRFAPQITRFDISDGVTQQVASGESIEVYGIIFSNTSSTDNEAITIEEADGTEFMNIEIDRSYNYVLSVPFVAHNGLQINPVGTLAGSVTIFHSSPGGGVIAHGECAPKYTQGKMSSDFLLENGDPVKVFGVSFVNGTATNNIEIEILTGDGNDTVLGAVELDNSKAVTFSNHFIADKGLKFTSSVADDDIDIVVFHSNPGL